MSIVKPTLKEALQRRWKLALGVFLLGALLALLTNTTDMSGTLAEMEAAAAELSEAAEADPEEVPTEELGRMARGAGLLFVLGTLTMFFALGVVALGSFAPQGLVAQAEDGGGALAAQQSMSVKDYYLRRYGGIQLATLVFMMLLGLTAAARMPDGEFALATSLGGLVQVCFLGAVACAISFTFAAFGNQRAAWLGLAYYVGSWLVGGLASVVDSLTGGGVLGAVLQFVIFPATAIGEFSRGVGAGPWDWGATGVVAYHLALWTALAWLGVRKAEQRTAEA